jgi:hypothetical protein
MTGKYLYKRKYVEKMQQIKNNLKKEIIQVVEKTTKDLFIFSEFCFLFLYYYSNNLYKLTSDYYSNIVHNFKNNIRIQYLYIHA